MKLDVQAWTSKDCFQEPISIGSNFLSLEDAQLLCRELQEALKKVAVSRSEFSPVVREYLEWSWNFSLAEMLSQETIKGLGREISNGIIRGEDLCEEDLVREFITERIDDSSEMTLLDPTNWASSSVPHEEVVSQIRNFSKFEEILRTVEEERS